MYPSLDRIKKMHNRIDRNHSELYKWVSQFENWDKYPEEEKAFLSEFMCFEDDYINIRFSLEKLKKKSGTIIDIGCQNGYQAVLFENFNYIGIDPCHSIFLKHDRLKNVVHVPEMFPMQKYFLRIRPSDIVISNMSLGFFQTNCSAKECVAKIKNAKHIFVRTSKEYLAEYFAAYPYYEVIHNPHQCNVSSEEICLSDAWDSCFCPLFHFYR